MTKTEAIIANKIKEFEEIGYGNQAIIVGSKRKELKDFIRQSLRDVAQASREEIVEKYGDFREVNSKKQGRTLRFYLLPHSEHKENDSKSEF